MGKNVRRKKHKFRSWSGTSSDVGRLAASVSEGLDVVEDTLEVMVNILRCQTCPGCAGMGKLPIDASGRPVPVPQAVSWTPCDCRLRAWALLKEFEEQGGPDGRDYGGASNEEDP